MRIRFFSLLLLCLFGLFSMCARLSANDQLEWNLTELLRQLAEIKEASIEFVEKRESLFLVDELELSGSIVYRAPDYMERNTTSPIIETVIIDGDLITIKKGKNSGKKEGMVETQKYTIETNSLMHTAVGSIRAMLAGNLQQLGESYQIEMTGDEANWALALMPLSNEIKEKVRKIALAGDGVKIQRIETVNVNGDQTTLILTYRQLQ